MVKPGGPAGRVWLARNESGRWSETPAPPSSRKNPTRGGGLKSAFNNNALLVYSTGGSPEESAWSLAKARYDAQTFWYRGNGAFEVVADTDFDPNAQRDRNVVLYGNADTNRAWPALLSTCPVQVRKGRVNVRSQGAVRPEGGEELATLFVYPRPGSDSAVVGVVGGAGLAGMRLTDRVRYFLSGTSPPDLTILGPESLEKGESGIRALGYFGPDWRVESGDIEWRDTAL
jgi:hypothetical protein